MIDLHCHILPGIDDGASSLDESVRLARTALKQGVSTIVATPHHGNGAYDTDRILIEQKCAELREELNRRRIPLEIISGAEVHMSSDILKKNSENDLIGIGDRREYVLIELPNLFIYEGVKLVVRTLLQHGTTPIIAHPERNLELLRCPESTEMLVHEGALMQITAGSLCGDFGPVSKKYAFWMLNNDLIHCLGSDWHPGRKYRMAKPRKRLEKLLGTAKAEEILHSNAQEIISRLRESKYSQGTVLAG